MPEPITDIDALERSLMKAREDYGWFITGDQAKDFSRALTALVAERDALKQRVAELEESTSILRWRVTTMLAEQRPADRDLRERDETLIRWMDQVTVMLCHSMTHSHDAKQELVTRCDEAIAAMRKEDTNGK